MSQPPPPTSRRSPLGLAIVCLLVGALGGAVVANSISQRIAAKHAYTRGVMHLMAVHAGALGKGLKAGQCGAASAHLDRLAVIEQELLPAFDTGTANADFEAAANKLRDAIAGARAAAPVDCAALGKVMQPIRAACKDCHTQYR